MAAWYLKKTLASQMNVTKFLYLINTHEVNDKRKQPQSEHNEIISKKKGLICRRLVNHTQYSIPNKDLDNESSVGLRLINLKFSRSIFRRPILDVLFPFG